MRGCSPGSQKCPGLHQKQHGQQVRGGGSAHLLCSYDTLPGVLLPVLGSLTWEGPGPAGVRKATKRLRGLEYLRGQPEKVGAAQPEGEKVAWRVHSNFTVSEGALQRKTLCQELQ